MKPWNEHLERLLPSPPMRIQKYAIAFLVTLVMSCQAFAVRPIVPPRYHKLVVNAYAGEKRVIALHGAYHNDPIEGTALTDLNRALDWMLTKSGSP